MLAREERVGTPGMKARVLRSGRFDFGTFKILALAPTKGAVVVPKRVAASAPARNRLRRRVAAILRGLIRSGALSASVVVFPEKTAAKAPPRALKEALERALGVR
jgi:RNase P protein component